MANERETSRSLVPLAEILIMLACCVAYSTLRVEAAPVIPETGVVQYLSQFGYLPPVNPKSEAMISEESFSQAISDFQSFVGINVTGNIDVETAHLMTLPRCGVKDKAGPSSSSRSKRYALHGTKWEDKSLTYNIIQYPTGLDSTTVDREIARALGVWSEYTDLTFTQQSGQVDIEISFVAGEHGDYNPFDGPALPGRSNTLAHAYFPGSDIGGDAHFDASEHWTVNTYEGVNLFQVAAHEFGHSLGLEHSEVRAALMAPFYRNYEPNFELHQDDIAGVQVLYGPKTGNGGQPNEKSLDICDDPQIDTIFSIPEGYTYVFKGDHYWRLATNGIDDGYPKLIAEGWKGLPNNIDAAFTYNGRTYFFKGAEYWTYVGGQLESRRSRKIRKDFHGIPDNIDAATVRKADGQIYFFKGSKFWRFNPTPTRFFKKSYPEPIHSWPGLPSDIDAAFSYNGDTYFFKGGAHYRFNEATFSMDSASPYETGSSLFGCHSENNEVPWTLW